MRGFDTSKPSVYGTPCPLHVFTHDWVSDALLCVYFFRCTLDAFCFRNFKRLHEIYPLCPFKLCLSSARFPVLSSTSLNLLNVLIWCYFGWNTTFPKELSELNLAITYLVPYLTVSVFFKELSFHLSFLLLISVIHQLIHHRNYPDGVELCQSIFIQSELTFLTEYLGSIQDFSSQFGLHLNTPKCFECTFTLSRSSFSSEHSVVDVVPIFGVEFVKRFGDFSDF